MLITILAHDKDTSKPWRETAAIIDYDVEIKVNRETVWRGSVEHHRANGGQRLLEKVAAAWRGREPRSKSSGRGKNRRSGG
jgi:hypothetical protein